MTELTRGTWTMESAAVGEMNPLPPILGDASLDKSADLSAGSDAIRANARYGRVASIAPYLMQDAYGRERSQHGHPTLVLENEHLTATFLPALGGRLWSLASQPSGRELLYVNPVFQPANLGLRNAWFAGGVEWNIGTIGHTPLTCSPLHAARVVDDDGVPFLRLYEFERLRRLVYQLDVHLPAGSEALYVHVRVTNANDTDVPLYWWSNIAVPQSADTRALAPADDTWNYSYDNILRREPVVSDAAGDVSYPARFHDAADFFFDVTASPQPWVVAVEADGSGLFQTSTARLGGRKLFRWGTSTGGRRWQEWLSGPLPAETGGYAEIQAGAAATQFEHLAMPAGAAWAWTEAYGPLEIGAEAAAAPWDAARAAAQRAVSDAVPSGVLAELEGRFAVLADRAPDAVLHAGSGWGALERKLRERSGEPPLDLPGTPFADDTIGAEQRPWLALLDGGEFPEPDGYPASIHLHPLLTSALAAAAGWAAPALRGVALAAAGDWAAAESAWRESAERQDNAYARRNLAVAARRAGDVASMAAEYRHALQLARESSGGDLTEHRALVIEALEAMTSAGDETAAADALQLIGGLPAELRGLGRVRMWEAKAALQAGDPDRAAAVLADETLEVADLREGEESLDELFFACRAALLARSLGVPPTAEVRTAALPAHLDFRMKPGATSA